LNFGSHYPEHDVIFHVVMIGLQAHGGIVAN